MLYREAVVGETAGSAIVRNGPDWGIVARCLAVKMQLEGARNETYCIIWNCPGGIIGSFDDWGHGIIGSRTGHNGHTSFN